MSGGNSKLVRIRRPGPLPSLAEAAEHLGVPLTDLDARFGVQSEESASGIWIVLLLRGEPRKPGSGEIFSNPKIGSFGPPRS